MSTIIALATQLVSTVGDILMQIPVVEQSVEITSQISGLPVGVAGALIVIGALFTD